MTEQRAVRRYAHMCRMDHEQIGHNDSEHEQCPLCRAQDERDALSTELAEAKQLTRIYQSIAGANLSGTDEADEIAKAHTNPFDAFDEAYRRGRERTDATIEGIAGVIRARAEKAESQLAEAKAEIERMREALERIANTFDESWRKGSLERSIGDRARAVLIPAGE